MEVGLGWSQRAGVGELIFALVGAMADALMLGSYFDTSRKHRSMHWAVVVVLVLAGFGLLAWGVYSFIHP